MSWMQHHVAALIGTGLMVIWYAGMWVHIWMSGRMPMKYLPGHGSASEMIFSWCAVAWNYKRFRAANPKGGPKYYLKDHSDNPYI